MKIVETQSAVLSNFEVLRHLQNVKKRHDSLPEYTDKPKAHLRNLHSIVTDLIHYLTQPHCPAPAYAPESISILLTRLTKYKLAKSELLTILNLRPASSTELEYIVEEAEVRYTQDQLEEILVIIGDVLGRGEDPEEDGEAMET